MKKIIFMAAMILMAIAANFAFADSINLPVNPSAQQRTPTGAVAPDGGVGSNDPGSTRFQIVTCSGVDDPRTTGITEKECTYEDLVAMVSRLIQFVLYLLIPIVLGMILFIGFKYLTANGDPKKLADAKGMIKPLLIGIFLIFAAWLIVYTLLAKLLDDNVSGVPKDSIVPTGIR